MTCNQPLIESCEYDTNEVLTAPNGESKALLKTNINMNL